MYDRDLLRQAKRAGCKLKETTKGVQILTPDGAIVHVHHSESDWRATRNTRARLRQHGVKV